MSPKLPPRDEPQPTSIKENNFISLQRGTGQKDVNIEKHCVNYMN